MTHTPVDYEHAWVSPSGARWIIASNPQHYSGTPEPLEIDAEGNVTQYSYGGRLMPSVGVSAKLSAMKDGTVLKHVTNQKERALVAHKEHLIKRQIEMTQLQYDIAKLSQGGTR